MDDGMDSVINEVKGVELYEELSDLWHKAGMHMLKWLSNSPVVMIQIPQKYRACELHLDDNSLFPTKAFGI